MVVDDNKRMRDMIKETLAPLSCTIVECTNGIDAVAGYETSQPDWVLMDVKMKPMNGITALSEIKKNHPKAKVIIVSTMVEEEIGVRSINAGAFAFVNKESLFQIPEMIEKHNRL